MKERIILRRGDRYWQVRGIGQWYDTGHHRDEPERSVRLRYERMGYDVQVAQTAW